jgi:hypothetical protein
MATIPDVTLTPYLTPVPKLAAILHMSVSSLQTLFGLNPGDMVTPYAFQAIQAMNVPAALANPAPPAPPLVIRADTVAQIRDAVVHYNAVIAYEAAANHATLVDIYSLVNNLAAKGIVVGGQRLTTDFQGGLFSLDGLHPTNTGYAVIANEFIKTMNRSLGTDIPPVSIQQVSKTDPLIFGASGPGKSDGHVSIGMAGGVPALVSR